MCTGRAAVKQALALFVLAAPSLSKAAGEKMRLVLVRERTDLAPVKISRVPDDKTTLLAVKDHGGIQPLDLDNRPGENHRDSNCMFLCSSCSQSYAQISPTTWASVHQKCYFGTEN
jgi:hypothetical protein